MKRQLETEATSAIRIVLQSFIAQPLLAIRWQPGPIAIRAAQAGRQIQVVTVAVKEHRQG